MKTAKPTNRRKFLLAASAGSAGAVAAVVGARATLVPKGETLAAEGEKPSGYHASEHILKYYKTTEV